MLSSEIERLRALIAVHPLFNPKDIYGDYTISNCSPATLRMLALKLNIPFNDKDGRGRPKGWRKRPPYGQPTPIITPTPYTPTPTVKEDTPVTPFDLEDIATPTDTPAPNAPVIVPAPSYGNGATIEAILKHMIEQALKDGVFSQDKIIDLIKEHAPAIAPTIERPLHITLKDGSSFTIPDGETHYKFPLILSALSQKLNVYLVGPAGSGKTTLASQVAKALNVPFYGFAAMTSEYKMLGFTDAHGAIVHTQFRKAYTEGGVACLDEIDAYSPSALLALNSALANGWAEFPDGMGQRHPDFYCIAGANTVGTGLSRQYVGRNQLDAASIDRFVIIDLPYDAHLEAKLVNADCFKPRITYTITPRELTSAHSTLIFNVIWAYREGIDTLSLQHVVSPRATMAAIKLYAAGWAFADILQSVVRKGLPIDAWDKLNTPQIKTMFEGL